MPTADEHNKDLEAKATIKASVDPGPKPAVNPGSVADQNPNLASKTAKDEDAKEQKATRSDKDQIVDGSGPTDGSDDLAPKLFTGADAPKAATTPKAAAEQQGADSVKSKVTDGDPKRTAESDGTIAKMNPTDAEVAHQAVNHASAAAESSAHKAMVAQQMAELAKQMENEPGDYDDEDDIRTPAISKKEANAKSDDLIDKLKRLARTVPTTTPDEYVLWGAGGITITLGDLRHLAKHVI